MLGQDTQARPARRRYAQAFKRELVERSLQPGASVSGIALDNGINANVLFKWRREHLRAATAVCEHRPAQAVLLPVKLATQAAPTEEAQPSRACVPAGVIEIDIGAACVRLQGSVDEADLRCVLQALKAIS